MRYGDPVLASPQTQPKGQSPRLPHVPALTDTPSHRGSSVGPCVWTLPSDTAFGEEGTGHDVV